jgi:hypothetical protein
MAPVENPKNPKIGLPYCAFYVISTNKKMIKGTSL